MKSDTCGAKLKGKGKCTVEVTVGKSCNLVFAAEFHRQPMQFIQQWCYIVCLSFNIILNQSQMEMLATESYE